ncbi:DUF397 domain-containing protein [Actinomadura sp. 3N407]|uniref:DUF397 domain-containing protein n=1 Tax=Actinomadura sp. 3N407 TaxID=3457423 RepID=UPI003FCCE07F
MKTPDPSAVQRRMSSHGYHGGECVELAGQWRKSSHSGHSGGECVEVADLTSVVGVRDSKDPDGPKLTFSVAAWSAFTREIKGSAHDLA